MIELVIRIEKINFTEALKILAERAGVELNKNSGPDKNNKLYEINFEACKTVLSRDNEPVKPLSLSSSVVSFSVKKNVGFAASSK